MKNAIYSIFMAVIVAAFVQISFAQEPRINFEKFASLENRATDVVEINIDGKMLETAKRVLGKVNNVDAKKVSQAIDGLRGVYVRAYTFANENEYNVQDFEDIRMQMNSAGWQKIANVRSKKNNQKVDVFTMFEGDLMKGLGVVVTESKRVVLVNVIGPIDLDLLTQLSGHLNIPKIEVEKETKSEN